MGVLQLVPKDTTRTRGRIVLDDGVYVDISAEIPVEEFVDIAKIVFWLESAKIKLMAEDMENGQ